MLSYCPNYAVISQLCPWARYLTSYYYIAPEGADPAIIVLKVTLNKLSYLPKYHISSSNSPYQCMEIYVVFLIILIPDKKSLLLSDGDVLRSVKGLSAWSWLCCVIHSTSSFSVSCSSSERWRRRRKLMQNWYSNPLSKKWCFRETAEWNEECFSKAKLEEVIAIYSGMLL